MKNNGIISSFENSNRNRYFRLFDLYEEWFTNKDYLSVEISRKIKTDLGIQVSNNSIHYIRSKIMPKRIAEKAEKLAKSELNLENKPNYPLDNTNQNSIHNFKFKEPQSIDHNQEIVTFRKSKI
jgi:hypothetical protein